MRDDGPQSEELQSEGLRREELRVTGRRAGLIRWVGTALFSLGAFLGTATTAGAVDCPLPEHAYQRMGQILLNAPCLDRNQNFCTQHEHYAMSVGYVVGRLMSADIPKSPEARACLVAADRDIQRLLDQHQFNTYLFGYQLGLASRPLSALPDPPLVVNYDPFREIVSLESYIVRNRATTSSGEGTGTLAGLWRLVSVTLPNGQSDGSFVGAIFEFSADGRYSINVGGQTIRGTWQAGPGPNQLTTTVDGNSEINRIVSANRSELILLDANGNRMVLSSN